ncbi:MAG TPA: hypothetical protein VIY28_16130 [Pseudonocardiaceae bacterium]
MFRDFYATMAQVLPVLLLALVWDSNYLQRLRKQPRALRRDDPVGGVLFWTKPRVRVYSFVITGLLVARIGVSLLVLADVLGDAAWLRLGLVGALLLSLVTLLVRISADVVAATRQ